MTADQNKPSEKNKKKSRMHSSSLLIVAVLSLGIGWGSSRLFLRTSPTSSSIDQAYSLLEQSYFGELDQESLVDGAIEGMAQAVDDPYTDYLPEEEAEVNENLMAGEFEGIGAEVMKEGDYAKIIAPIDGSPAQKAGLQANDLILAVDGKSSQGLALNEVVELIRGEKGSPVQLTIQRDGQQSEVEVIRDAIPIETVQAELIDADLGLGWVKLSKFSQTTYDELVEALKELKQQGVDQVIFDVRQNPGGLLDSALKISNIFAEEGDPLMAVENTKGEKEEFIASEDYGDYRFQGQAVLLIDEGSASAAEILAGAMKSQGIPLIGQASFGKGTVQSLLPLKNHGQLKMTTARWLTAEGEWINEKGLQPDIAVDQPAYSQLLWVDSSQLYQEGMQSDEVKNINAILQALGYDSADSDRYDQQTRQAVQSFQADHGIDVDGKVSGQTATQLVESLREKIKDNDRQLEAAIDYFQKEES